jgi:porphobilinogen synthase
MFPSHRPRRLRRSESWRSLVRETVLRTDDLVWPLFVVPGSGIRREVSSMPGVHQLSVDTLLEDVAAAWEAGVRAVILFGVPDASDKDAEGSAAHAEDGLVPTAIRALKNALPELLVWADVCLCEYTDHGHCGLLRSDGTVDNDATLPLLAQASLTYARAGADAVAPSDMMDGRILAIRDALDHDALTETAIVAYSAKYASAFYGPFRDAAHSAPAFGDRRAYQMDPPNRREAQREMELDLAEGADILMVKPAGPYLDIISDARQAFDTPIAAYQVSGEYSLIQAGAKQGWIDERRIALESLVSIKRAGADMLLTYFAPRVAEWLRAGDQ